MRDKAPQPWHLPVAAETYNGWLSDNASFPVTVDLALAALDDAKGGPVAEGNVVGGTAWSAMSSRAALHRLAVRPGG